MATATTKKERKCKLSDCDEKFIPRVRTQLYHSQKCKNRAAQERFRKNHKNPQTA